MMALEQCRPGAAQDSVAFAEMGWPSYARADLSRETSSFETDSRAAVFSQSRAPRTSAGVDELTIRAPFDGMVIGGR